MPRSGLDRGEVRVGREWGGVVRGLGFGGEWGVKGRSGDGTAWLGLVLAQLGQNGPTRGGLPPLFYLFSLFIFLFSFLFLFLLPIILVSFGTISVV